MGGGDATDAAADTDTRADVDAGAGADGVSNPQRREIGVVTRRGKRPAVLISGGTAVHV